MDKSKKLPPEEEEEDYEEEGLPFVFLGWLGLLSFASGVTLALLLLLLFVR